MGGEPTQAQEERPHIKAPGSKLTLGLGVAVLTISGSGAGNNSCSGGTNGSNNPLFSVLLPTVSATPTMYLPVTELL